MAQSPNQPTPTIEPLRDLLHVRRVQASVDVAELIRDYPDCLERTAEAERHVRQIMLEFTVGAITDEERARILEILAFAIAPLPAYLANPDPPPWTAESQAPR